MKLILRKLGTSLVAQDRNAVDDIAKIRDGDLVKCEVVKPRSIAHHRWFFALVRMVWDNCDTSRYPTEDDLRAALTISAGHRIRIDLPNGEVAYMARSISFDKMDELQFREFTERCLDAIYTHFIPGLTSEAARQQIEEMTSGRAA